VILFSVAPSFRRDLRFN